MNVAALVLAFGAALGAAAGPVIDAAAEAVRRDSVYVAADADPSRTLTGAEADRIRQVIESGARPVFVAVLPEAAAEEAGGLDRLPAALGEAIGLTGTVAVVTPQGFRAASNDLPSGLAPSIATAAFQAEQDNGVAAVLEEFVSRVQDAAPRRRLVRRLGRR